MDFKKILIKLRKVIAVLFALGYDKHLDYDQKEVKEEESHNGDER
jgi:hypothetical protein